MDRTSPPATLCTTLASPIAIFPVRIRKQLKVRPGFTPQEDVGRFRGTKQQQMDQIALPKGHIIGWTPPPASSAPKPKATATSTSSSGAPLSKNAKKRQKQREKKSETVKDNWEDDDEGEEERLASTSTKKAASDASTLKNLDGAEAGEGEADGLAEKLKMLEVQ